ncbi:MAG: asparagine--tRNA ligase [Candidatus Thorarchaeota archaeon]|nr:MAG: asparagine--tRNA ligase [Candidatus Thorarchaeota archaeon]RLI58185.1 MAG: asparagine--tRNA ligase [Candidatus Thorarchaeota archaeon]
MEVSYIHIKEVLDGKHEGKQVHLRGWVHRIRKQKKMVFVLLRDTSGVVQTVIKKDVVSESEYADAQKMLIESLVTLTGTVQADSRAEGGYEVQVSELKVLHFAEEFPITENQSIEFLNDNRHLWLRSRRLTNVLKVRDEVFRSAREYLRNEGFYETTCPMFVSTMGEEGAELFEVEYFGRKVYLTQTSQMHLEPQLFALEKVFTLAPSFRAEKSRTRKHLTEFWHLEVEEAWCDHECNLKRQEGLITYMCHSVADSMQAELKELGVDSRRLYDVKAPFDRMTYDEAIEVCQKAGLDIEWGQDLRTEAEHILTDDRDKFLFVEYYPKEIKSFYMKHNEDDPRTYKNNDLLAPHGFGEMIGASERETDYQRIIDNLTRIGDDPEKYSWYLDIRKYGSVPHSGFGVGMDRLITWMLNLEHIRDCIPFPRTVSRVAP